MKQAKIKDKSRLLKLLKFFNARVDEAIKKVNKVK